MIWDMDHSLMFGIIILFPLSCKLPPCDQLVIACLGASFCNKARYEMEARKREPDDAGFSDEGE
jgi:hypothetical protein